MGPFQNDFESSWNIFLNTKFSWNCEGIIPKFLTNSQQKSQKASVKFLEILDKKLSSKILFEIPELYTWD